MKNVFLLILMLLLSACSITSHTWVLEKDRLSEVSSVKNYVEQLQTNEADLRGYRVFTISEGSKMVVVSSGSIDKALKFVEADVSENNTTISVEEISQNSDEANPYILIGIDEIKGELTVVNENGDEFKVVE
ncbi:hypothetical protein LCM10_04990 [Rossellomorea aquimaris]|uniref:hypothetical protein n=1 Tax=Rossellomorea aquimaris TaxID=189382 RepID=UPI001CD5218F|nr:hypothetical protein [Rossellomorea aquimaris]MCA1054335.1 hypothetical protein [Rossellomorea aquimaris]